MNAMRKRALLSCALIVTGLFAAPAWAGSVQCDNDRAAGQYPCDNMGGLNYVYRSGQSGDWNGDDRLNSTNSGWYGWFFPGVERSYSFYAWLNNGAFTDAYARYGVIDTGNAYHQTAVINQNTAPGGWNYAGYGHGYLFTVTPSGNGRNGADIVQLYYSGSLAATGATARIAEADRDLDSRCPSATPADPRIAALQQRMLNAADAYRDVAGSVDLRFRNNGQNEAIDFEVSRTQRSSFVRIDRGQDRVEEHATRNGSSLSLYPQAKAYQTTLLADLPAPDGPRAYRNARCEPVFVHRGDSAGAIGADNVISPQNYAFWLSTEDVRIAGRQRLLGRVATVVAGKHGDYLGSKLGADSFRMWVDDKTGALLKLVGRDRSGAVAYSIDVRDLRFDTGLELKPALAAPQGWSRLPQQR